MLSAAGQSNQVGIVQLVRDDQVRAQRLEFVARAPDPMSLVSCASLGASDDGVGAAAPAIKYHTLFGKAPIKHNQTGAGTSGTSMIGVSTAGVSADVSTAACQFGAAGTCHAHSLAHPLALALALTLAHTLASPRPRPRVASPSPTRRLALTHTLTHAHTLAPTQVRA